LSGENQPNQYAVCGLTQPPKIGELAARSRSTLTEVRAGT
jgi:hypothetical protein